jgi:hypothetical protein
MRYVMFSAGGGSWRAAKLDRKAHPDAEMRLVFTDGLYEDADAYRFLIEGAANVLGRRLNWTVRAEDFPDYRVGEEVPIAEYRGNSEWRAFLADLRARAVEALPELIWLVEGRDPWEVFRDHRLIGNSRIGPCSDDLKQRVADRWRKANCDPARDVFLVGIGEHERHRFEGNGGNKKGLRHHMAQAGWQFEAPLLGEPEINPTWHMRIEELSPPRLYGMGYLHNNCGGFCCKAGQAHWQNRFRVHPERFAYDAMMERKLIAYIGPSAWPMLTDRRGDGKKKRLSLDEFERRLRDNPQLQLNYEPGESGCGCMLDEAA